MNRTTIIIALLIAIISVGIYFQVTRETTSVGKESKVEGVQASAPRIPTKDDIDTHTELLSSMDRAALRTDKERITDELKLFNDAAMELRDTTAMDEEAKTAAAQLKAKLISIQKADYPILRKNFGDWIGKKLWEEDVDVVVSGPVNSSITIVNPAFTSRKNVKRVHDKLLPYLQELRFANAKYTWRLKASDYTTIALDPLPDGEPAY